MISILTHAAAILNQTPLLLRALASLNRREWQFWASQTTRNLCKSAVSGIKTLGQRTLRELHDSWPQ